MGENTVITILGMAAVTYATRASGLVLGRTVRIPHWFDDLLEALPGAILISLIAPAIIASGVKGVIAAAATLIAALLFRGNIVIPMLVGIFVIAGLSHVPV
jgi:branched chain amino acid efflux pump